MQNVSLYVQNDVRGKGKKNSAPVPAKMLVQVPAKNNHCDLSLFARAISNTVPENQRLEKKQKTSAVVPEFLEHYVLCSNLHKQLVEHNKPSG